jgi:feruloyl-CoA synthase
MFKEVNFGPTNTIKKLLDDGEIHFRLAQNLEAFPQKITDKLTFWAENKPEKTFIAKRDAITGNWVELSYSETLKKVKSIAQYLTNIGFTEGQTIVILSENSIEHALLALAALYIGIPFAPISPAYSLISNDLSKLRHCLELLTPKVVFAQKSAEYQQAIDLAKNIFPDIEIITADDTIGQSFDKISDTVATEQIEKAFESVHGETIAKILFTSGSTGLPKGVINTHNMWMANLQQICQIFPFMKAQSPMFIDWLPWNHTFGGNHNFGLCLYNGGTLYIDEGKPTASGIEITAQNLREIAPTAYFNVPKGFEMLIPFLENEPELRRNFFKNLNIIFYAGASLAQPIWDKLEELAMKTIGVKIPIITGLGCTESGPSAMFASWGGSFSGLLGVPVAGLEVKLVPDGDKLEARYKGPNVTKGYWRNEEDTQKAFDEKGFYKTGDAVKFLDENAPDKGLIFDGRIAEDFKLSTGTWVNVGVLKAKILSAGSPIVQDLVLTGLNKEFVGAILFLNTDECRKLIGENLANEVLFRHQKTIQFIDHFLAKYNKTATGSSNKIGKYVIAIDPPSIDLGEITDKGSLNQRAVLKHRVALVDEMYA